ncbi:MAG: DUF1552 domain-containing protein, partial [Opitutae bacterium]
GLFVNQIGCSYISYDKKGGMIPRESDPQLVFDKLFRNPLSDPGRRAEMSSLLDRVSSDAKALQRKTGVEDGDTLDEYFTALRETELKLEKMGPLDQGLESSKFDRLVRPLAPSNLDEQVNAMLDVIAMALWTDSTRCISYMLGNSNSRMI